MNFGAFVSRALASFQPDPTWSRPARFAWVGASAAYAIVLLAVLFNLGAIGPALSSINANLAYGFARVDPLVTYQEIRGRYSYCGYDWDRRCQVRNPAAPELPLVDRWLTMHLPGAMAAVPPTQGEISYIETEGAQSLIVDDLRIADTEYFLGLFDVVGHVAGLIAAGGIASTAAILISLALGFATFGGARMRLVNPLWAYFAFFASAVYAWVAIHVLAIPAIFALVQVVETLALLAVPALALARVRKMLTHRETVRAYWAANKASRRGTGLPTPTP